MFTTSCEPVYQMNEYGFRLVLEGVSDLTEELVNRLFESGCDDALPMRSDGVVSVSFIRTAPSLKDATDSAIHDVRKANVGGRIRVVND